MTRYTAALGLAVLAGCSPGGQAPSGPDTEKLVADCDAGEGDACYELAAWHWSSLGGATFLHPLPAKEHSSDEDVTRAVGLYGRSCELAVALGCFQAGWAHAAGVGVDADESRASQFYQKAAELLRRECDASDAEACYFLGQTYSSGIAPSAHPDDPIFRADAVEEAEDLLTFFEQKHEKQDEWYRKAAALGESACEAGDAAACYRLGLMAESGDGQEIDYDVARHFYGRVCDLGEGKGCRRAGESYELATGPFQKDPAKARAMFEKGCELGDERSCSQVGR